MTEAVSTTRRYPSNGNVVEETRYLFSQYHIEYNADFVVRAVRREVIEGPAKGAHDFIAEMPKFYLDDIDINDETLMQAYNRVSHSWLVPSAEKVAEAEGRILRPLGEAFEMEVSRG